MIKYANKQTKSGHKALTPTKLFYDSYIAQINENLQ